MRILEVGDVFINFDLVYKVKLTDTHNDDVIDSANVHFVDGSEYEFRDEDARTIAEFLNEEATKG